MSEAVDSLNEAILESRRQLHDLQEALQKPDIDYSQVLEQITTTGEKIKSEADRISDFKYNESTVLPLAHQKKPPTMIEQIRAVSPKEFTPSHSTKAYELKKKYIKPGVPQNKPLPRLSAAQKQLPAVELLKRGLVSETDDLSEIMPQVAGNQPIQKSTLFNGIAYDFRGAAEASKRRREAKKQQEEVFTRQMEKVSEKPPEEKPEPPLTPTEPAVKKETQNPRIYEQLQDEYAYQTLLVVRGKVARETPDFESFQRTNASRFKSIDNVLNAIEGYCAVFGISYAEIDGRKLSEAANLTTLTYDQVGRCLIGTEEQVEKAKLKAANLIKFNWKVWKWRHDTERNKKLFKAAYTIQMAWRMNQVRRAIILECRKRIESIDNKADELSQSIVNKYSQIESDPYVVIHVMTNFQDLTRVLDLMYNNVSIILLLSDLPPGHIWEDFIEFMGCCGIPNVNQRVNYVIMRDLRSGNNTSNKLLCDMRSINQVRRLIASRNCFIIPHSDWHSERRLSVDINCPIFGCVNTNMLQGRNSVRDIFREADVVSSISTREMRDFGQLCDSLRDLLIDNKDITRWIIHLGFIQSEDAIAWFDTNQDFYDESKDLSELIKKNLHAKQGASKFIQMIPRLGATCEAVPSVVRSFPSVCCLITGNEIRVVGTYDRIHYQPFRFCSSFVPAISCNAIDLITKARQVATILLKRGAIGYSTIDFLVYSEKDNPQSIIGFDVRVNTYPSSLNMCFVSLCCGFEQSSGKMKLLKGVGDVYGKKSRFAVVHSGLTHPGLSMIGTKDLKSQMFSEGLLFDLLQRVGFKLLFLANPSEGKNIAIAGAKSPENALALMEKAYTYMLKLLSPKSGGDLESSISSTLIGLRHFKTRIFP